MGGPSIPPTAGGGAIRENDPMSDTNNAEQVTSEIGGHVEAFFDAFLAKASNRPGVWWSRLA
jgi:hypothetical protein